LISSGESKPKYKLCKDSSSKSPLAYSESSFILNPVISAKIHLRVDIMMLKDVKSLG
jgi:hypothetical protein